MEESEFPVDAQRPVADRLDSWKKIAVYLKRDVSTVQRWERREGMPVHRHLHDKQGSVFAYRGELDDWWRSRGTQLARAPADLAPPTPEPAAPTRSGPVSPQAPPLPRRPWPGRGVAALALLLLAAGLGWMLREALSPWRNPLAGAAFSRLSSFAGTEQAAAISPDGKFVAFLASREGSVDAWIGAIGSGDYRNLTHGTVAELINPSIRTLGFSADSSMVSIWTRHGNGSRPDDVRLLATPTAGGPLRPYLEDAAEFDWTRDGRRIVYHTTAPGDPLWVRERGAPSAHQVYAAAAGEHCHFPLWSDDGEFIYFVRGVPPDHWDLWRIRSSGVGLTRLTHHDARVTYPVMLDHRRLAYLVTEADGSGPWIYGLDVEDPNPHRLTSGLDTYTSLAASADGLRLIATTASPRSGLWRVRLEPGGTPATAPELVSANAHAPRLGPGFLVFVSTRSGEQGIWTLTGGTARQIWHGAHHRITGVPSISPDGRRIAFTVDTGTGARLMALDPDGGHPTVLADSLPLQGNPSWSPDGRSVVSAVMRDGEPRLTRIFLNGDPPAALLREYSTDPVWSPDGRFIVYSGADIGTTLTLRAAAADGRPYAIPGLILTRGARRVVMAGDPPALLVLRGDLGHKDVWAVDLEHGGERRLTALPPDFNVEDFDLSADGTELILDRIEDNSDLALIERPRHRLGFGAW